MRSQSSWFKRVILLYLLLRSVYWLAWYEVLFGANSVVYTTPGFIGTFKSLPYLLYNSSDPGLSLYFLVGLIALCLVQLFYSRFYFVFGLLTWLLVLNICNKVYSTLTGGDTMLYQLLFFNCFISGSFRQCKHPWVRDLVVFVHNLGVAAILIQVCLAYFLAGLAKVLDAHWINGEALYIVTQADYFNPYFVTRANFQNNFLLCTVNYLVLFYQLLFPGLVWIKKIKKPFLLLGILMHLYIMLFMGLVWFGLIMIICYIWFWPMKKADS